MRPVLDDTAWHCHRRRFRHTLSRPYTTWMVSVVPSVESICACGLNPEVLYIDAAAGAADVRGNFTFERQPAMRDLDKLSVQPYHFALHSLEPSTMQVCGPELPVTVFDSPLQASVSSHLQAL